MNTHSSAIAQRLAPLGLELNGDQTIGDNLAPLAEAIRNALQKCDVVFVTGGLGPTFDDLTREAAAEATGRPLIRSKLLLAELLRKFRRARYRHMPPANRRQADLLKGASAIPNAVGTAPGQWLEVLKKILILLPGPPSELYPMLDGVVLRKLRRRFPTGPRSEAHLHFVGVPESAVDHLVRPIIKKAGPGVDFTILAHLGLVDLDIFVKGQSARRVRRTVELLVNRVRRVVGRPFYGRDEEYPLEKVVGERFQRHRATLSVAESCTGGMLGARLTDVPGSSRYFLGGVVSYKNSSKASMLGVPPALIARHGAVSRAVAAAMADGARRRFSSTHGLSITGVAGPGGGSAEKPVGLVFIALASPSGTTLHEFHFPGPRSAVRQRAVVAALDLLRRVLN